MNISQIYIAVSIVVLAVIAFFVLFLAKSKKGRNTLTPLAGLAFSFISAVGFDHDRLIGYSLLAVGVVLAVIDMVKKIKV